jgi:UDP-N-acetyl-2-amino-2-deoxyglucuronate dehydrogenase
MLIWIFGDVQNVVIHDHNEKTVRGKLELKNAKVNWQLSIDSGLLPAKAAKKTTYRSLQMEGKEIEFSDGFTNLHTLSYQQIISGNGFGLSDARPSIQLIHEIRKQLA